jgi:phosphatidylinositol alpha-1,6-mannosyltransferase
VVHTASVVSLWDQSGDRDHAPPNVEYHPCGSGKIRFLVRLIRLLTGRRYDVVVFGHVVLVPAVIIVRLLRPRSRRLLLVHGIEAWDRPALPTRWLVRHWMGPVIAVSSYTSRRMAESFGLAPERFGLLPCAVDSGCRSQPARPFPAGRPEGAAADRPTILTVSRLIRDAPDKNVDKVVAAMPAILRRHPTAEYLVIGDGDWLPDLRELAGRIGVAGSVRFVGSATDEERDACYARSDLFVLPSTQEGFGIVFLEAWLHGLPVVAADAGAAPELLGDGLAGVCVAPRPDVIAGVVSDLLADTARRRAMAREGRRRATQQFSHEQFRRRLEEILT